jgi:DNA-binding PucR family transcriptional regulator
MSLSYPHLPSDQWPVVSPQVRELLRQGADHVLNAPAEWLEEIDLASLSPTSMKSLADDPVLMAASRRATRSSLIHWAAANIENPGAPVSPYVPGDMFSNARELLRRGETELMFNASRAAQGTAWQQWMLIAFELTADPEELRELLTVSARSIGTFIEGNMEVLARFIQTEREERMRGTHVERRELVTAIVEGSVINTQHAGQRLGYNLEQAHHAAVIWSEEVDTQLATLELAATALARCAGSRHTLTVIANAATLWVWTSAEMDIDLKQLLMTIKGLPGVRLAIGSKGQGSEGFRRAHLDALTTQRLLGRLQSSARVVDFDMVRLVSLMARDRKATQQFVTHTLGGLATAAPVLRRALLTFLRCGSNATQAAEQLHTHRNTLLRRLSRAEELLPRPLHSNLIHVAAALETLGWTAEETR